MLSLKKILVGAAVASVLVGGGVLAAAPAPALESCVSFTSLERGGVSQGEVYNRCDYEISGKFQIGHMNPMDGTFQDFSYENCRAIAPNSTALSYAYVRDGNHRPLPVIKRVVGFVAC